MTDVIIELAEEFTSVGELVPEWEGGQMWGHVAVSLIARQAV